MESSPFIPSPPNSMLTNDSYFVPQICTDTTSQPPELDLRAIYRSQRSCPYPQPILMSSSGSINLSNVSPAESLAPLPIPRPATLIPPAMSPRTIQSTLAANDDIDAVLLHTIANSLLTTIANRETDTAMQFHRFTEQIKGLQDRILEYEETFERALEGYILNNEHIPHFCIPCGHGLSRPAKWIKLNDDGTVLGFVDTDGPKSTPHIIDLYTQPDNHYTEEGDAKPALPLPPWFRFLLVGPSVDFALLHNTLVDLDDWGLTREVHRYRNLDREFSDTCIKLKQMQVDLNAISQARSASESWLLLARASEQVEKLKNVLRKPQATCSAWKRKSSGRGRPI